ncbi:hypothetical protein [Litchfieldia salsa]|uniref:DUF4367 domain-containing protein n=1 Tax=Litchfieldia salsa TaxID=930152 RepID=A0A1H0P808_9BACI|nr:hypothetical protein [Litchfieldia salsa]SDP00819.1 hypothetical protein SAMN05216565_101188 [Litchfieldia salsa]
MVKKGIISYMILIGLLVGCSASVDEVIKETETTTEEAFKADPIEPNQTETTFSYFLPSDMKEETVEENNLILQKGKQLFILFVNPNEEKSSEELYQSTVAQTESDLLNETFKDDKRFGYIKVEEVEEDSYQLSIGIGGVKMTTVTKLNKIEENAEKMMQIVSSVDY